MQLKIGIVGLPNVGKSTLFKALTKTPVNINNYPFCTIDPNIGIVKVPDERLLKLAELPKSAKVIPAVVEFVDIAGLVKGASVGEGLGNKFLANIREVNAIAEVVRIFQNSNITHVHNKIDPAGDIEVINTELILADLETAEKTKARLEKIARGALHGDANTDARKQLEIVDKIRETLETGKLANETDLDWENENVKMVMREMPLLTAKPFLYVYNVADVREKLPPELEKKNHIKLDVKIEEELMEMSEAEAKDLGMESNVDLLIKKAYELLGLITYFTTGPDETRAWTIKKGSSAPLAGAAIHNDFKEKFIRAEVIQWKKLLEAGGWLQSREKGFLRIEGKEYVVQDGDVMEFKI